MINQIPDKPAMGSLVGLSPAPRYHTKIKGEREGFATFEQMWTAFAQLDRDRMDHFTRGVLMGIS